MQRLILIVLSAFFFLATPALAKDHPAGKWIVSQRSGDVRVVHRGLQPASVKVNTSLAPGDVVMTGATGRATLARGSDYIVVAPRSELRLPAEAQPGGFTRVIQQLGTMLFKVKHTGVPHFAVDTPMLAAVVKGTTFTVIVDKDRSAVQVLEGAVQVIATDGGMQRLVEGGNTVFIDHKNSKQLIFATPQTLGASGASSTAVKIAGSGDESVSEIASLTTGLVRAEAVPAPIIAPTEMASLVNASAPLADNGALIPDPTVKDPPLAVPGGAQLVVTIPPVTDALPIAETLPVPEVLPILDPVVDLAPVEPVVEPIIEPVVEPIVELLPVEPIAETIVEPIVETVVEPVVDPVVEAIMEPIVDAVVEPIVETVVEPIVEAIVEPIFETVVEPVVDPVVEAIVEPIVETVVEPIVEAIVEPIVGTVVAPVVNPVVEAIVEPIVDAVVEPVVETVVEPIVEPIIEEILEPVVEPIVETVVEPVVETIVAPIVAPVVNVLPLPPLPPLGLGW